MTWEQFVKLQIERAMANWNKPPLIKYRPLYQGSGAEMSKSGTPIENWRELTHQFDKDYPEGAFLSDTNPHLINPKTNQPFPSQTIICGSRINPATSNFWTSLELDEIATIEPHTISTPQDIRRAHASDFVDQLLIHKITELNEFATSNNLDAISIINEEQTQSKITELIVSPQIDSESHSVKFKFIKPNKPITNNKELLRQLAESRQCRIRNPKFFTCTPPPELPVNKQQPPIVEQDKLVRPFHFIDIEFPNTTITDVRTDLWQLACGKCYLKQTHFLHQQEVFVKLHNALLELIKTRDYAFEKFEFAMQHNLFGLTDEDDEPRFEEQETFWKVLDNLRRLLNRLARLSGIRKSHRGITTTIEDQEVNMDESWCILLDQNTTAPVYDKMTDEEIIEQMFILFPHMRQYHANNPNSYNIKHHRKMFNCGYFHCQGKRKPERKSWKYRRIPSPNKGYATVWRCSPSGKLIQNITPSFSSLEAAKEFEQKQLLHIDIRLDPNRGFQHRSQIGRARFAQIGQQGPLVHPTSQPNPELNPDDPNYQQPSEIPEPQQDKIQKEVDGTIHYISELEAEDFDPRLRTKQTEEDELNY